MRFRLLLVAASVVLAASAIVSGSAVGAQSPQAPILQDGSVVEVQILGLNDFHGHLEPPGGFGGRVGSVDAGGAEYLATHIAELETTNANSIVVSAGDLIGASPLLSALFHDEPTIEAMNKIGLDLNAVGNHEFDEGVTELRRMKEGGCHPDDGCLDGDGFSGANFDFLAANVVDEETGEPLFAPYRIKNFNGARVAFVGMTLEGTPEIVSPSAVAGYEFRDEAETVNALVPELRRRGVESIVVLLHEGGLPANFDINGCAGISGPIVDITERMDDAVDLVISGHTHQPYNCVIDGTPVTSAYSYGRLVTDIDLRIDRATRDVVGASINNEIVTRDVEKSPEITSLIERYRELAAPIANRPIGRITDDITRENNDSLEQSLGNTIADAQLAATDDADTGDAVLALMNPGGVRADLFFESSDAGEGDGVVTYGEAFTVQPFGNSLVTMSLTGAQIERVLEKQFCGTNSPANGGRYRVLLPSAGLHYTWTKSAAGAADCTIADAVDPDSITLNGTALEPSASYRVTVNSFLADGGDGFTTLTEGTDRLGGAVDVDAFEAYLGEAGDAGLPPAPRNRIDVQP
ncbi:bifunctional metallophosphatase/5'-nucleotidase [Haloechinothrix halophila]|uniref:bifunctional metallophosphatase/5'-nucleotidase n=1 Tax=Haloechinothrix halophila TaxID=1069073 RepID=UPI000420D0C0|nr:bifunctional metallophosphatase/5'-nucleotidase [Haloechinothrix halophila]